MSLVTVAKTYMDNILPKISGGERVFREEAWRRVESGGLPKRGTETWKYTSLAPLDMMNWTMKTSTGLGTLPADTFAWVVSLKGEFDVAVFVNGEYVAAASKISNEIQTSPAQFDKNSFQGEDGFADVSLAVARTGLCFRVRDHVRCERPLLIVKYQNENDGWISSFNQIELGKNSELTLAEVFIGGETPYLRSDILQINQDENSKLKWLRHQTESASAFHFAEAQVHLAANAGLHFTQMNRGAHWLRGQMLVKLAGKGAEAFVHGLTYGAERQHIDQRIVLSHTAGETTSSQLFKGVYKDSSKGVLNGKIHIARDAQKVSSQQMNHNLLLSSTAEANTKPELEIYADDVKANHGATVGRLDEEKMFYLRSRGISEAVAEQLLSEAFVADVLMKIPDARLRRLAGEANVT